MAGSFPQGFRVEAHSESAAYHIARWYRLRTLGSLCNYAGTLALRQCTSASLNRIWGLPLEEYLFFIFVPLAAILTIEAVRKVNGRWKVGDER